MSPFERAITPPAQVVESFVPASVREHVAHFAAERSVPWWKAIDGPSSEDHNCVMEGFVECEDMLRLERMCLLSLAAVGDRDGAKKPDVQKDGEESKRSKFVGVQDTANLQKWNRALTDYLMARKRTSDQVTQRKAMRAREGGKKAIQAAIRIRRAGRLRGVLNGLNNLDADNEELTDPDETALLTDEEDDSDQPETPGTKRNVVIRASPDLRQGNGTRSRLSQQSGLDSPPPGNPIVASDSVKEGHESSELSARSRRNVKSTTEPSLPFLTTPMSPASPKPVALPNDTGPNSGVPASKPTVFRTNRKGMTQSFSKDRLKQTGSHVAKRSSPLAGRSSPRAPQRAGSAPQSATPRKASGSLAGAGKRDSVATARLQRTGASVASGTPVLPPE